MFRDRSEILVFGLLLALLVPLAAADDEEEVDWKTSFDEAKKSAGLAQLPLFVQFVRDGNKDCLRMAKVFNDPKVIEKIMDNVIPVRLNADLLETRRMMNRYKVNGTGMPYMVLFRLDMKIMTEFGGYLPPDQFIAMFGAGLQMSKGVEAKNPVQKLLEYQQKAEVARQRRFYGRALELYGKMIETAKKLQAGKMIRNTQEDMKEVDEYGSFEVVQVKKKLEKRKIKREDAIAIAKRVMLDFKGRGPEAEAKAFLDELRKNPKLAELVEKTEAMPEGYERAIDEGQDQGPRKVAKAKPLTKLKLKDGTELMGTIVARSGDQLYFRPQKADGTKGRAKFIKLADIEEQEEVEATDGTEE